MGWVGLAWVNLGCSQSKSLGEEIRTQAIIIATELIN